MLENILENKLLEINNTSINAPEQIRTLREFARDLNEEIEYYEARAANLLNSLKRYGDEKKELQEELDEITLEYQEDRAYNKEVLQLLVENNEDLRQQLNILKETNEKLTRKLMQKELEDEDGKHGILKKYAVRGRCGKIGRTSEAH